MKTDRWNMQNWDFEKSVAAAMGSGLAGMGVLLLAAVAVGTKEEAFFVAVLFALVLMVPMLLFASLYGLAMTFGLVIVVGKAIGWAANWLDAWSMRMLKEKLKWK